MGIEGQSSDTGYRATRDFFDGLGSISRGAPPFNRPTGVALSSSGDIVYVTELCLRMSIFSYDGNLLARWGNEQHPIDAPLFIAPHTLAVDSHGDIYIGKVSMAHFRIDRGPRTIQKVAFI